MPNEDLKQCLRKFRENPTQIDAVQNNGQTMLQMAAECGNLEVLQALLQAGANPNAEGRYKRSALNSVINSEGHNPAMIRALIDAGADVNHQDDDGVTPLHKLLDSPELGEAVIQKTISLITDHPNVNINLKNKIGQTPLALFMARFPETREADLVDYIRMLIDNGVTYIPPYIYTPAGIASEIFRSDNPIDTVNSYTFLNQRTKDLLIEYFRGIEYRRAMISFMQERGATV